jgi:hypothetical protein
MNKKENKQSCGKHYRGSKLNAWQRMAYYFFNENLYDFNKKHTFKLQIALI